MKLAIRAGQLAALFAILSACATTPPAESTRPTTEAPAQEQAVQAPAPMHKASASAAPHTTLIPREVIFGNPDRTALTVSPDGKNLSWLAPLDGVLNVYVAPVAAPERARAVTRDTKRGVRIHFWAFDNQHLLYLQDEGGDENWRVHKVNLATLEDVDLTPLPKVQARILSVSHKRPNEILVGLNDRDPKFHDVHKVDLRTGKRSLVLQNDGWMYFVPDEDYRVRLAGRMTPDGGAEVFELDAKTLKPKKEPFAKISQEDTLTTQLLGFDTSGQTLYMTDSRGRDTAALVAVTLKTGQQKVLAEDARADFEEWLRDPKSLKAQAASFNYTRREWKVLDAAITPDLEYLETVADGELLVLSRSLDDSQWAVVYLMDNGPLRYYRYDRKAKKASFLFTNRAKLEGLPLAKMQPVVIKSRDGLELVSYLTVPPAADPDGDLKPNQPVPMVLLVHGGPWGRDRWGYNGMHQWLANRGYAVLSVNFRASTGFGKKFLNAGDKQWGTTMHDDLLDAVKWAVEGGITNHDSVAIMGGSYGGYATLAGLTFTPEAFACGVDIVGPSNLITLLESIPPYWGPMLEMFATRVGDPRTPEGRKLLEERSPLSKAHAIVRPLLIGQGANDPRVKKAESDQIVRAMQEKNIPVTYVLYPDEGHGFARPPNMLSFQAVAEAFLGQCLGGGVEPVGDDFQGSSIQIPAGASVVPGIESALPVSGR